MAKLGRTGQAFSTPPPDVVGDRGYPRPMLRREGWGVLNGTWEFALDPDALWRLPREVTFDAQIEVPFAPETRRSGVHDMGLYRAVWYRRTFEAEPLSEGDRFLLHFGAVDHAATVWIDGNLAGGHEGGYTPFELDVSALLGPGTEHELVVRAEDDPTDLTKPRGKQDWQLHAHSIWYPRTTGIWQTVWFERVGRCRIAHLRWTPNLARWALTLDAQIDAPAAEQLSLGLRLRVGDILLADDRYSVVAGEVHRSLALSDPGIDDFRNELLWSPEAPTLIDAQLTLYDADGDVVDRVRSYTALREVSLDNGRFVLNGRPYPLRLVLDQGYWPESGLTAPADASLRRDVELAKAMGFNGARKHQKIEDPRYLYWADHLGLLVWTEMPSAYRFTTTSIERLTREWLEVVHRDACHPCVIAWVPFNESWGVPNLPDSQPERHYVEALYHLTKTLDPTRPVVGNDGWESVATDVIGIHDYDDAPGRLEIRYGGANLSPKILERERPGGRALVLQRGGAEVPIVLSEFGGIALAPARAEGTTWGYSRVRTAGELAEGYGRLLEVIRRLELFAGFCYTQFADTYQEANGLLYADRTPKFPLAEMSEATAGPKRAATTLGPGEGGAG